VGVHVPVTGDAVAWPGVGLVNENGLAGVPCRGAVAEVGAKGVVVAGQQGKAIELVGVVIEADATSQNRFFGAR